MVRLKMHSQKTQTETKNLKVILVFLIWKAKKIKYLQNNLLLIFASKKLIIFFVSFTAESMTSCETTKISVTKFLKDFKVPGTVIWALQSKNVLKWELIIRNL